jgi:uncharacterized protein YdhG (YjbR/CyaY superfamily)
MATTRVATVNEYLALQPAAARRVLERVRSVIRRALPAAEEAISYGIPTYTLHGRPVVYFAGFARHFSLYPSTRYVVETLGDAVAPHLVSKGTMRFSLSEPMPARLIQAIAKARAREVQMGEEAKAATGKRAAKTKSAAARRTTKAAQRR